MAFLIAHMPRGDRDTMRLDLLRENVEYAYRARRDYPWTRALPDSVFLNEVLPYAAVDEVRDSWRRISTRASPARGALPRHPRGDRLREPEYRGRRRGGVQHRPRKDQPEPCRVDAAAYGLLYGAFGAAGRRPARGGNPARFAGRPRGTTTAATTAGSRYGSAAAGISRNITPRGSTMPGSFRMPGGRSTTVCTASSPCRSGPPATGFRWCGARTRVRCTGWTSRSVTRPLCGLRAYPRGAGKAYDGDFCDVRQCGARRALGRPRGGQCRCLLRCRADGRRPHGRAEAGHERCVEVPAGKRASPIRSATRTPAAKRRRSRPRWAMPR